MKEEQLEHAPTDDELRRVRAEAEQLLATIDAWTSDFHRRLEMTAPITATIFPSGIEHHRGALEAALAIVLRNLDALDALREPLHLLGAQHAAHGVGPALLRLSQEILLDTLRAAAPSPWTRRHDRAWRAALAQVFEPIEQGAASFLAAAAEDRS